MSTFVLHPPAGVRVVAFFITARLGAQDTREAFTEVVLEQLAELLGQDLPPLLRLPPGTPTCSGCWSRPPRPAPRTVSG